MEDPHAALLSELRGSPQWAQRDPIIDAFELQLVARGKLQFVPHRLRQHDSAEFIEGQFGSHAYQHILGFTNYKWQSSPPPLRVSASFRHLLQCLARGPLGVFELALAVALLGEVASVEQLVLDLLQRQAAAGGMLGPRHIGAVKIAAVSWIGVKLRKRLNAHVDASGVAAYVAPHPAPPG